MLKPNSNYLQRLRGDQLRTMLRILKLPLSIRHEGIAAIRLAILSYAQNNTSCNQEVWSAYHSIKGERSQAASTEPTSEKINTEELVDEILQQVMKRVEKNTDESLKQILESRLREIRQDLTKYRKLEIVGPVKAKKVMGRQHSAFEKVVQLASQRVNTLLVGPAGSGKTYLGEQVAKTLGLEFSSISCSAGMSESQLSGWLLPTGAGGKFEYAASPYVTMYKDGGVFLFDEMDSGDPNTLTFVNKGIANNGFFVPQNLKAPYVKKHKDFVCIAAANTFGNGSDVQYVGRNQLDAATLDRFKVGTVVMDYDKVLESELIHPQVLEWGWKIRDAIYRNRLRRIMSTRVMLDMSKMTEAYRWSKEQWNTAYFSDWSADERRRAEITL